MADTARQNEALFGLACQVVNVPEALEAGRSAETCCVCYTNTARPEDEFGLSITALQSFFRMGEKLEYKQEDVIEGSVEGEEASPLGARVYSEQAEPI